MTDARIPFDREKTVFVRNSPNFQFRILRCGRQTMAVFLASPRLWFCWKLRSVADWIDGGTSYSFDGGVPENCTTADWSDAIEFGVGAMARYLADVSNERKLDVMFDSNKEHES